MKPNVLVTGASGFVGEALCLELLDQGYNVYGVYRHIEKAKQSFSKHTNQGKLHPIIIRDINAETDWTEAFSSPIDVVIHLAARVHIMGDKSIDSSSLYRNVNVEGSKNLANIAAQSGVKRFIYLSSIKVNGESSAFGASAQPRVFTEQDTPQATDAYGISKYQAEVALKHVCSNVNMDYVIVRPPLVYGPKVGANFLKLMSLVARRRHLPFKRIENQRSMIYVGNLTNAIISVALFPAALNKVFLVSDSQPLSTAKLIELISKGFGYKARLFTMPSLLLRWLFYILKKKDVADRLLGSLVIDSSLIRETLNWTPPYSTEVGIENTVQWYQSNDN